MKSASKILITGVILVVSAGGVFLLDRLGRLPGTGGGDSGVTECPHHMVPERCPFCTPDLVESMGMCPGHGVPEALCHRCNPALVEAFKAAGDWCGGHDLPESQCEACNPGILDKYRTVPAAVEPEAGGVELLDERTPRSLRAPSTTCRTETLRVQFASLEIPRQAGLEIETVREQPLTETLTSNAEVEYDANRLAHIVPRVPGVVHEVRKDQGDPVEAGEVLAVVDSAELGTAKAELLQSKALVDLWERNHAREQDLLRRGVSTERDALEAETRLVESRIRFARARQHLRNLGLTVDHVEAVLSGEDPSSFLSVVAPFAGVVVDRHAVRGELVGTTDTLFVVADLSVMWARLDVYASDLQRLRTGLPVVLRVDGLRGESFGGRLTWISPRLDPRTRTLEARAGIANPEGLLRAHMFGRATVSIRENESVLLVPADAVQWEGCCNVVFVRRSETVYEPRKVRLGYETDGHFVVIEGLSAGEPVVTQGSFLLKTEILKGSIGAGCCETDPGS